MKLVFGNELFVVKDIICIVVQVYKKNKSNLQVVLDIFVKFKGIGFVIVLFLFIVYDFEWVIFFFDEVFYWLCGGGEKVFFKYNVKEYVMLREVVGKLQKRLDVFVMDVEKVVYVLFKVFDIVFSVLLLLKKQQLIGKVLFFLKEQEVKKKKDYLKFIVGGDGVVGVFLVLMKCKLEVLFLVDVESSGVRRLKWIRGQVIVCDVECCI